jgi:hypothetical protein
MLASGCLIVVAGWSPPRPGIAVWSHPSTRPSEAACVLPQPLLRAIAHDEVRAWTTGGPARGCSCRCLHAKPTTNRRTAQGCDTYPAVVVYEHPGPITGADQAKAAADAKRFAGLEHIGGRVIGPIPTSDGRGAAGARAHQGWQGRLKRHRSGGQGLTSDGTKVYRPGRPPPKDSTGGVHLGVMPPAGPARSVLATATPSEGSGWS